MRFRKLFICLRLWQRAVIARRHLKRAQLALKQQSIAYKRELDSKARYYETQLERERVRYQLMMNSWADRFLQKQDLHSVSISTLDLEDKIAPPKEQEIQLNPDQLDYFNDTKAQFWADGREEGHSDAEIERYWDNMKEQIARDVAIQVQ